MSTVSPSVQASIDRWVEAESGNNAHLASNIIADDFMMVGPVGFVLNKAQWLVRFDQGLHHDSFALTDVTVREYDSIAVGIGDQRQETVYQGRRNDGNFRVTLILTRVDDTWKLLGAHLSPMMGPA